jgi:fatty acid/phospholipid biosynthesis enzyme
MLIAVDAMGGDYAPLEPCQGAIMACREKPHMSVALVGDSAKIKTDRRRCRRERSRKDQNSTY